jgi:dihydrofolate synthase/folylpolyglutamate synthase
MPKMPITTFDQMIHFLEGFTNLERQTDHYTTRVYRLDRMGELLAHLGNPERRFRTIHLAGSKGKGSTASYIASGLTALGEKTGLFLSPHLNDWRERFTLAGTFFEDELLVEVGNHLIEAVQSFTFRDEWGESSPTTFELLCCYAYLLFAHSGCQWAVIETGLGGRLDATNTITPEAVVLCPIELEHTKILGSTIAEIATEKSKIIKAEVPVFIGFEEEAAMAVFLSEAHQQRATVHRLDHALGAVESITTAKGEQVSLTWNNGRSEELLLSMRGRVQAHNSALALLVLRTLGLWREESLVPFSANTIPGRFQQLRSEPDLYLDGAHTLRSLTELLYSFSSLYPVSTNTVIYGALEDKDHLHMAEQILSHFRTIIISRPGTFKKSDPKALKTLFEELSRSMGAHHTIILEEDNSAALKLALSITPPKAGILACGSFYLAGGIKEAFVQREGYRESQLA